MPVPCGYAILKGVQESFPHFCNSRESESHVVHYSFSLVTLEAALKGVQKGGQNMMHCTSPDAAADQVKL